MLAAPGDVLRSFAPSGRDCVSEDVQVTYPICNIVTQFSHPTGGTGLGSAPRRSVKLIQGMCFTPWRAQRGRCFAHTGCFNAVVSIGSFRKRLPVAAKIALVTAGGIAEVPHSPIPPGGSELWTMWTSMAGASFMRKIW